MQATEPDRDPFGAKVLEQFFAHCHRRQYPTSGSVSVLMEDDDGHEIVLAYLGEGDFFGEIGLFDEFHRRSAFVRTRKPSEIATIGYERLTGLVGSSPEVLFAMLAKMTRRVRATSRKLGDLAFLDVTGRIAGQLLQLCDMPEAVPHPLGTQVRVTRQELARLVGCSREVASRVVKGLEEQGAVAVDGRNIVVLGHHRRGAAKPRA